MPVATKSKKSLEDMTELEVAEHLSEELKDTGDKVSALEGSVKELTEDVAKMKGLD